MLDLYQDIGYPTQFISKNDDRVSIVDEWNHGLIVLSGQSGVGKTTFLNHYRPELNLETNDISKSLNRGKHTTRHVELYERNHGFIADTPGFSALDFDHIEKDELKITSLILKTRDKIVNLEIVIISKNLNVMLNI